MVTHRAGVDARLRQAETARAEAVVREAEQRKRCRLRRVLARVLVAALVAGGVAAWWIERQRGRLALAQVAKEEQARLALAGIGRTLERVPGLWERYLFRQADEAVDQAEKLLGPDPDPVAAERVAKARRETDMLRRLDELLFEELQGTRAGAAAQGEPKWGGLYLAAFRDGGSRNDRRGGVG